MIPTNERQPRSESPSRRRFALCVIMLALLLSPAGAQEQPPREEGKFRQPELVELTKLDRTIKLDIRYATANNFLGRPDYTQARAFLQKPAARALARVSKKLRKQGYGLLVFDGYRPWSVTKTFWDATPADKKVFVADPAKGSRHNRGCAVDLSLYDLKTGGEIEMTGAYDEMTERSHVAYAGGTPEQRRTRDLLRRAMEAEGFQVYEPEWWHFDYKDWKEYPILNISFDEIGRKK
jgi:D-alanyl-D-alanine dipeptidase